MRRSRKPKTVNYQVIDRADARAPDYALLDELVSQYHDDLAQARIALAWCTSWKPDVDGRCTLGKCKKASDLDRELAAFDFVILLRRSFWQNPMVSDAQRAALLDHELMHAALKYDAKGEPVEDERGRRVYRVRKHDIEEFTAIVERHGIWTADLERFAAALRRGATQAWQPCDDCREMNGWVSLTEDSGVRRVKRCACYTRWHDARDLQHQEQPLEVVS